MIQARLAQGSDLPTVQAITEAAYVAYVEPFGGPPVPLTEDYAPRIAANEVWIVSQDGVDMALAVLEAAPDHLAIFSLAVRPEAQGRGLGRWILDFAEDRARSLGLPEVRLYTNALMTRNILIYGKAGYAETGRTPNPHRPGWIAVHMAKPLH